MARLVAQREQARARVDELEAEQREATTAAQQASAELVELERKCARPGAQRSKLETQLAEARAKAGEPWAERIAGARPRVGDRHAEVQAFVSDHLQELVADREAEGAAAPHRPGLRLGHYRATALDEAGRRTRCKPLG
jgi:hypothetical protein